MPSGVLILKYNEKVVREIEMSRRLRGFANMMYREMCAHYRPSSIFLFLFNDIDKRSRQYCVDREICYFEKFL